MQLDDVLGGRALAEGLSVFARALEGLGQWQERPLEAQAAELTEAQRHGGASRRHLDVGHLVFGHEQVESALHDAPIEPHDLAGLVVQLRPGRGVAGQGRRRPAKPDGFGGDGIEVVGHGDPS